MAIRSALVTGGLGFVGSAIVNALHEKHPSCLVYVLDTFDAWETRDKWNLPPNAKCVLCDILFPGELEGALSHIKPDVVIHTAGIVPPLSERYHRRIEDEVWRVNFGGTCNVLNLAMRIGISAFVYTSSCCSVVDDWTYSYPNIDEKWPTARVSSIYGESKVTNYL